ncbi:unnamed protein product [Plutella xylostella]|uniref:(diamondback moth) hypothetical protein n=1 Tax=Plutella xylostella TaxID=51655 RepID=A0A8S4F9N1_PLUXY|nr:unnamed protein product [Plutella xylostella]
MPWLLSVCCVLVFAQTCSSVVEVPRKMPLLPGKHIIRILPEFLASNTVSPTTMLPNQDAVTAAFATVPAEETAETSEIDVLNSAPYLVPENPGRQNEQAGHTVRHAGVPRQLAVVPAPLPDSDHELMFNVTWAPPLGTPAEDYSLEIRSETPTTDCEMPLCYEYNIPGDSTWWVVPAQASPAAGGCGVRPGCAYSVRLTAHPWDGHTAANLHVEMDVLVIVVVGSWWVVPAQASPAAGGCGVRPGCAYSVRLTAHPWDGHTAANLHVEMDECVSGVCSCAHAPRLPAPSVDAHTVSVAGELFINITWTLPPPRQPLRLPPGLKKQAYLVSIGKQMVSDAHPAPWFSDTASKVISASGAVAEGDSPRWRLLPVTERSGERGGKRTIVLDVKLLARVSLIDERGCMGPAGKALWASLGGACVLGAVIITTVGFRGVKRILNALRAAPAPTPIDPALRPAWLPWETDP